MYLRIAHLPRDNLHGFPAGAIPSDVRQVVPAEGHPAMPGEQHLARKRRGECPVEIDHHLRDALLGRRDAAWIECQPQLPLNGGLHAGPIENFALNLRSRQRFSTDRLDDQLVARGPVQVLHRAQSNARAKQKLLFRMGEPGALPLKVRPIRLLPIPGHERYAYILSLIICRKMSDRWHLYRSFFCHSHKEPTFCRL